MLLLFSMLTPFYVLTFFTSCFASDTVLLHWFTSSSTTWQTCFGRLFESWDLLYNTSTLGLHRVILWFSRFFGYSRLRKGFCHLHVVHRGTQARALWEMLSLALDVAAYLALSLLPSCYKPHFQLILVVVYSYYFCIYCLFTVSFICYTVRLKTFYTVSQKKHVTTFSTITLTISVRLQ